ncbi:MAG: sugar phosphate isomerase/epimerase [Clostridiales bacterium]|jgi:sugar phosphate isomerase/epimerase|nr:sugar phosphate isomerase/epimerase [Clostridiales bacterium]
MEFPTEKLGFTHHMLYPGYAEDEVYHADTVLALARRPDIGCLDCCLPINPRERKRAAAGLRGCGKQITYVNHLFPARKISLGSGDFAEQRIAREFLVREVEAAAEAGADQFLFVSGIDMPWDRDGAIKRFAEICLWLCELLRGHGITPLIEPLDTAVDKRFLIGSTETAVSFVESLRAQGADLALEVDMGHVPLLFESFESAYRRAAEALARVHLSSCVVGDTNDPMFGDTHPSFFYPAGLHRRGDLTRVLRVLKEIGYLDSPGKLVFEVNPLPSEDPEKTIRDHTDLLASAFAECGC